MKAIYKNKVNVGLTGKKLKPLPLKLGTRQGCLIEYSIKLLARAIRQEKEIRDTNRKGRSQIIPICR
jgi:hypothetical protein